MHKLYLNQSINLINIDLTTKITLDSIIIKETLLIDQIAKLKMHDDNMKGSKIIYNIYF